MSRPLRIEYPGAVYHVTSRGNNRADVFRTDEDRERFLGILAKVVKRFNWLCHAWCLMDNHYHLLIETLEGNLSAGMRQLGGVYTQAFNRAHGRDGHLFRGRFKSILVEKQEHLLELCRYVVLNPVRAGMVAHPTLWRWSSYRATLGEESRRELLATDWLLANFAPEAEEARSRYRRFVEEGIGKETSPWQELTGQIYLGTCGFVERAQLHVEERHLSEVPRIQRYASRPALAELFPPGCRLTKAERNDRILRAHEEHGYLLREIAQALGIHYTTVSKVINSDKS